MLKKEGFVTISYNLTGSNHNDIIQRSVRFPFRCEVFCFRIFQNLLTFSLFDFRGYSSWTKQTHLARRKDQDRKTNPKIDTKIYYHVRENSIFFILTQKNSLNSQLYLPLISSNSLVPSMLNLKTFNTMLFGGKGETFTRIKR